MQLQRLLALTTVLLMAPVGCAQATTPTTPAPATQEPETPTTPSPGPQESETPTTPSPAPEPSAAPAGTPASIGGVTVTILGVHPSVPANAVVVVAEVTTEIELRSSRPAIYVTANEQQFETEGYFDISSTVFPGISKVVAWSFGTPEVNGTIHWTVIGVDVEPIEFSLQLS